jgi:hypothetical protein
VTQLSADFEARLNYPKVPPASFNSVQLAFNARMAKELRPPPDLSPRLSYTRDITIEEIEPMKRHIKAHGLDTAIGVDGFSYQDCLDIPNEKLLEFFLYYLKNQDMPRFWLMSLLIGILKKDKDATDPSSYRLIALECCMLKMLTLIIDRRIREGAQDIGAIPPTQNGFQDGLRTNDNVFVLSCLIAKAESLNKPLYVAYLDLKNAFPGTDRSTLWVKFHTLMKGYKTLAPIAANWEALDAITERLVNHHTFPRAGDDKEVLFGAIVTRSVSVPVKELSTQIESQNKAIISLTKKVESLKKGETLTTPRSAAPHPCPLSRLLARPRKNPHRLFPTRQTSTSWCASMARFRPFFTSSIMRFSRS